jgi:hypothetical protein
MLASGQGAVSKGCQTFQSYMIIAHIRHRGLSEIVSKENRWRHFLSLFVSTLVKKRVEMK